MGAPLAHPQFQFCPQGGPAGQVRCVRSHPPGGAQRHGDDVSVTSTRQAREQLQGGQLLPSKLLCMKYFVFLNEKIRQFQSPKCREGVNSLLAILEVGVSLQFPQLR